MKFEPLKMERAASVTSFEPLEKFEPSKMERAASALVYEPSEVERGASAEAETAAAGGSAVVLPVRKDSELELERVRERRMFWVVFETGKWFVFVVRGRCLRGRLNAPVCRDRRRKSCRCS